MFDWSAGAEPYKDINRDGPTPEKLPHRYLGLPDGFFGEGWKDDGQTCQFTAGRTRCRSTINDHVRAWPDLYPLMQLHSAEELRKLYGRG